MEDRRSSFPTRDTEPEPNILDGFHMRTENEPLEVVHKRYFILLVVGVLLIGFASFYAPVGMMRALHCPKDQTAFTAAVVETADGADAPLTAHALALPEDGTEFTIRQAAPSSEVVALMKDHSTAHILQQDAVFNTGGIFIYPDTDSNYALYAAEEGSYIFALDKLKARYVIRDNESFYPALLQAMQFH